MAFPQYGGTVFRRRQKGPPRAGILPVPVTNLRNIRPVVDWDRLRGRFITPSQVNQMANIAQAAGHQQASALPFQELQAANQGNLASASSGKVLQKVVRSVAQPLAAGAMAGAQTALQGYQRLGQFGDAIERGRALDVLTRLNQRISRQSGRIGDYYRMLNLLQQFIRRF